MPKPDAATDSSSEYELEKAIRLEAIWFGTDAALAADLECLHSHCLTMQSLQQRLSEVRAANRKLRTDAKGEEIKSPLARSWHR
jgi:hypothetical protein